MKKFSKRQISNKLEKPVRTITYWTDRGLVRPDIKPSRGKGRERFFSERNLIEFGMIDLMLKQTDLSLSYIGYILAILQLAHFQKEIDYKAFIEKFFDGKLSIGNDKASQLMKRLIFEANSIIPEIQDFYTNPEWGVKRELIFMGFGMLLKADFKADKFPKDIKKAIMFGVPLFFVLENIQKMHDTQFEKASADLLKMPNVLSSNYIYLGKIKNIAMKRIGLKS